MKKIICSIVLAITCSCMFVGANSINVIAADNSEIQHAGYSNGETYGLGAWHSGNERIAVIDVRNPAPPTIDNDNNIVLAHLSDGEGTWYEQSVLTWQTVPDSPSNLLSGEFETIVEIQPTQTVYPTTVKFRMANATSGETTADFIGLEVVSLGGIDALEENRGKIFAGGQDTGLYYKSDETYIFKILANTANDTYSTYLVSGAVASAADGVFEEVGEETLLTTVSNINNGNFGFVRTVDFMVTGLPTNEDKGAISYLKNIEFNVLPFKAKSMSEINIGDNEIPLEINHWVKAKGSKSTELAGTIIVKKNGIPLSNGTDYTVAASYCARGTLNSWARKPVITLTEAIAGGDIFEIDFNNVEDIWSRRFSDKITLSVSAQAGDVLGSVLQTLGSYVLNGNSDFDNITSALRLSNNIDGVAVTWTSSDEAVIDLDGNITRPQGVDDKKATITAALTYDGKTYRKAFDCTVKTTYDNTALETAFNTLTDAYILGGNTSLTQITQDMNLPQTMDGGITVTWTSGNNKAINDADGKVTRPKGYNDYSVLLTAVLSDGIGERTKDFSCIVKTTFDPTRPPKVSDISVEGVERVGNTMKISYNFEDVNGLSNNSSIQWEYSEDGISFSDISGADSEQFVIDSIYEGKYLRVLISPKNSAGTDGQPVYSKVIGPVLEKIQLDGVGGGSAPSSRPATNNSSSGTVSFSPSSASSSDNSSGASDKVNNTEDYRFLDVSEEHWAFDNVNKLVTIGIISQDASRNFRPDDSITRAEFVKMLVTALNLEGGTGTFTDMEKSDWAYKYAAAAFDAGIVTGYTDGTFRGSQLVTRQEIAVMVKRAIDYRGWKGTVGEKIEFTDLQDISNFAADSVAEMSAVGVINGLPDGRFLPTANATRAETAKMICEVYDNV